PWQRHRYGSRPQPTCPRSAGRGAPAYRERSTPGIRGAGRPSGHRSGRIPGRAPRHTKSPGESAATGCSGVRALDQAISDPTYGLDELGGERIVDLTSKVANID